MKVEKFLEELKRRYQEAEAVYGYISAEDANMYEAPFRNFLKSIEKTGKYVSNLGYDPKTKLFRARINGVIKSFAADKTYMTSGIMNAKVFTEIAPSKEKPQNKNPENEKPENKEEKKPEEPSKKEEVPKEEPSKKEEPKDQEDKSYKTITRKEFVDVLRTFKEKKLYNDYSSKFSSILDKYFGTDCVASFNITKGRFGNWTQAAVIEASSGQVVAEKMTEAEGEISDCVFKVDVDITVNKIPENLTKENIAEIANRAINELYSTTTVNKDTYIPDNSDVKVTISEVPNGMLKNPVQVTKTTWTPDQGKANVKGNFSLLATSTPISKLDKLGKELKAMPGRAAKAFVNTIAKGVDASSGINTSSL